MIKAERMSEVKECSVKNGQVKLQATLMFWHGSHRLTLFFSTAFTWPEAQPPWAHLTPQTAQIYITQSK